MNDRNVVWQHSKVSFEERCRILGQAGMVIWLTGLSGAGKSTIAIEVERRLHQMGKTVYLLDGDNIRCGINSDLGFTDEDRDENIRRVSEIASLFKDAGVITLVSFISPFRKMRQFAKERAGAAYFQEVFVKADVETCMKRDPKGLYKKKLANFTGVSSTYEEPENPDLVLETEILTVDEAADKLIERVLEMQDKLQKGGRH